MAKDNRTILSAVRIGRKLFTDDGISEAGKPVEGDPHDELAKVLSAERIKQLTEKGAIVGFVKEPKGKEK